ncbi:polyketide synthase [Ruminiclostridium josui]|uniref:polyketide synthase n=1 Tax=Ruminiclostridium josui TaxID=1499 RepID=UPI001FA742D4|nr:polyketide synthase [Ruminiclostridium josui]
MKSVVYIEQLGQGIVLIKMEDRENKNTFSDELMLGLKEAFESIKNDITCKVVIMTGYDNYFCTGGTKEGLLALNEGKEVFTDKSLYNLPLNCEVPVIAAMQGHGIGGGFALGLFADSVILARESIYSANFMRYGFTPGFGATFILPNKLGSSLAQEMLYSADNYRGAELERRGVPFPVLPRLEVLDHAYNLAKKIAEKPRLSLITLKEHFVAPLRIQLNEIIRQELIMHEKTFRQDEVRQNIIKLFGN